MCGFLMVCATTLVHLWRVAEGLSNPTLIQTHCGAEVTECKFCAHPPPYNFVPPVSSAYRLPQCFNRDRPGSRGFQWEPSLADSDSENSLEP
jgi:hypothetical protein